MGRHIAEFLQRPNGASAERPIGTFQNIGLCCVWAEEYHPRIFFLEVKYVSDT
jgi:hypothetical protein